jgi:hypothetical protein
MLAITAVAGCSPGAGPSASPSPSPSTAGSVAPTDGTSPAASGVGGSSTTAGNVWLPEWAEDAVPADIANRRPLHFCGLEKAPAPAPGEFIDPVVRACFWDAWLNEGSAEFASVQSTMEGDPVATIWRLNGDGTIDLLTDGTQDRFGSGGWLATRCASLVETTEGGAFFGVQDCGEGVPVE